ncbi:hypothetical protein LEP1GSC161_0855 [Leptospira santarosai str. CBC1416]|uniref:Uncharacterized protein n=2 Tax=Leptospira santarosai TaxID=28183 RepID=K8Y3F7_9LEPT|nr:hypothetical protein LSS_06659 [Leptospira santarosai serovar Shermani str. LT 821]EMJ50629.1 hypothetical protein LEP1GSC169_3496 [Leptospira santarosai str. HAI1349]EMO21698.1 hypothetical protein LEP1GSC168_1482 [Leptospira santarosai str. HAI134]EMO59193.1 hypothetical protein LEP1GSC161_0855 [Leptospira santarosai str. CBC1416]KXZ32066.1 hypothetical protein AYB33_15075 [Leptospira santarosai]
MRSRIRSFHKFVIKRKNPAVFLGVLSTSERIFASFDSYNVVVPTSLVLCPTFRSQWNVFNRFRILRRLYDPFLKTPPNVETSCPWDISASCNSTLF